MGASVIATQQGKSGEAARNYVKDVYLYADGVNTPVASLDGEAGRFTVEFYVGEEGKLTFGAKNMTDQNYAYSANGMNWFAMDNFSLLYLGETDLSVDLSTMRKEADAIREDEVTSELWQQLVGLKESASDGIETAVRYQRVLGEIHLLQVHYEDYKDAYERYKKFVETEGVDDISLKEALELFAVAGSADEVFRAYENLDKAWKAYLPHAGKAVDVSSVLPDGGRLLPSGTDVMFDNRTHWMTDAEGGNYRVCHRRVGCAAWGCYGREHDRTLLYGQFLGRTAFDLCVCIRITCWELCLQGGCTERSRRRGNRIVCQ